MAARVRREKFFDGADDAGRFGRRERPLLIRALFGFDLAAAALFFGALPGLGLRLRLALFLVRAALCFRLLLPALMRDALRLGLFFLASCVLLSPSLGFYFLPTAFFPGSRLSFGVLLPPALFRRLP